MFRYQGDSLFHVVCVWLQKTESQHADHKNDHRVIDLIYFSGRVKVQVLSTAHIGGRSPDMDLRNRNVYCNNRDVRFPVESFRFTCVDAIRYRRSRFL